MPQKTVYKPHYSTSTNPRVGKTRTAFRRALLKLLDKKPWEDITVRDITATAGVGYATFFRHYVDKQELLNEIAVDEIHKLTDLSLTALGSGDTKAAALTLCGYVAEHRALWSILLTGGAANILREEFIRISADVAETWETRNDWLPAEVAHVLVASSTIELLSWWLKRKAPISVTQLAAIYERAVVALVIDNKGS